MNGYVIAMTMITLASLAFSFGLFATNKRLQSRIGVRDKNLQDSRNEARYWLMRAGNFERERNAYRHGLDKVIALRTVNMASIGQRMSRSASVAINEGERLKTEAASR